MGFDLFHLVLRQCALLVGVLLLHVSAQDMANIGSCSAYPPLTMTDFNYGPDECVEDAKDTVRFTATVDFTGITRSQWEDTIGFSRVEADGKPNELAKAYLSICGPLDIQKSSSSLYCSSNSTDGVNYPLAFEDRPQSAYSHRYFNLFVITNAEDCISFTRPSRLHPYVKEWYRHTITIDGVTLTFPPTDGKYESNTTAKQVSLEYTVRNIDTAEKSYTYKIKEKGSSQALNQSSDSDLKVTVAFPGCYTFSYQMLNGGCSGSYDLCIEAPALPTTTPQPANSTTPEAYNTTSPPPVGPEPSDSSDSIWFIVLIILTMIGFGAAVGVRAYFLWLKKRQNTITCEINSHKTIDELKRELMEGEDKVKNLMQQHSFQELTIRNRTKQVQGSMPQKADSHTSTSSLSSTIKLETLVTETVTNNLKLTMGLVVTKERLMVNIVSIQTIQSSGSGDIPMMAHEPPTSLGSRGYRFSDTPSIIEKYGTPV